MAVTRFPLAAFIVRLFGACLSLGISCIFKVYYAVFMPKRFNPEPLMIRPYANFGITSRTSDNSTGQGKPEYLEDKHLTSYVVYPYGVAETEI